MAHFTKTDEGRDFTISFQELKRLAQPDDIGDVVALLASDGARWITERRQLHHRRIRYPRPVVAAVRAPSNDGLTALQNDEARGSVRGAKRGRLAITPSAPATLLGGAPLRPHPPRTVRVASHATRRGRLERGRRGAVWTIRLPSAWRQHRWVDAGAVSCVVCS